MNAFSIVVAIVVSVLFLLADIYLMVMYSHKNQSNRSFVNIFCKILIIITMLQTQFQPLFLILDATNTQEQLSIFWFILYLSLLANLAIFKPIATSLYERDHDQKCCVNTMWILLEIFVSTGVFALFTGVNYALWENYSVTPVNGGTTVPQPTPADIVPSPDVIISNSFVSQGSAYYNFLGFIVAFFCILGYPILICCGGCGMSALPISLFIQFANRPKFRRTSDARKVTQYLKVQTVQLLKQNERLQRSAYGVQNTQGFFEKRRKGKQFQTKLTQYQGQVQLQKDFFDLFKMELQIQDVNPIVYCLKLTLGILIVILGILLWFQILFAQLVFPPTAERPSVFIDSFFVYLSNNNATFVAVGMLMAIAFYFAFCIIRGSIFLSGAMPFIKLHPIAEDKTWLNSFLFHFSLCSLAATALIHLLARTFPKFLGSGSIITLLNQLNNLKIIRFILQNKIFTYAFIVMVAIGIPYACCKMLRDNSARGELIQRIDQKRAKLFGKQNKDHQMIEMVQLNKNQKKQKKKR